MNLQCQLESEFWTTLRRCRKERKRCLAEDSADAIHDLRVATRRFLESAGVFTQVIRPSALRSLHPTLRAWMKLSSKVRDLDIAIDLIEACACTDNSRLAEALALRRVKRARAAARQLQKPISWPREQELKRWWRAPRRASAEGLWDLHLSSTENGALVLPLLLYRYRMYGDLLVSLSSSDEEFHLFRLRTKRLRYTMEWFLPLFANPQAAALVATIKGFQQSLGRFQDCIATTEMLGGRSLSSLMDPESEQRLRAFLQTEGQSAKEQFLSGWEEFRAVSDPHSCSACFPLPDVQSNVVL